MPAVARRRETSNPMPLFAPGTNAIRVDEFIDFPLCEGLKLGLMLK
jgi:hypothetical protein